MLAFLPFALLFNLPRQKTFIKYFRLCGFSLNGTSLCSFAIFNLKKEVTIKHKLNLNAISDYIGNTVHMRDVRELRSSLPQSISDYNESNRSINNTYTEIHLKPSSAAAWLPRSSHCNGSSG